MTSPRAFRVTIANDYFLGHPDGDLYLWRKDGNREIVPANEAARARVAAGPAHAKPTSTVQVFVLGSTGQIALVYAVEALSADARACILAVLARDLPNATPVFCSHDGPGVAVAVSAPHGTAVAPDAEEIAACVAVMKASAAWDETPVMAIEADGVRCEVEMGVGEHVGDVRVAIAE